MYNIQYKYNKKKTTIDQVSTIKFFGVFIDTHLNWSHHISKLIESMRPIAGLFFRLSNHIPRKVLTVLYYSLILSKISYCIDFWGNAPKTHINKLSLEKNYSHYFQKTNRLSVFRSFQM